MNRFLFGSHLTLLLLGFFLSSCSEEREIRRYKEDKSLNKVRVIAAMVPYKDTTWFFKMSGPKSWVGKQKDNLNLLLASMSFSEEGKPSYTLPQGWKEESNQSDGFIRFLAGEASDHIDITVKKFPFGSKPATQLASINIVRETVSLPKLKELGDDIKRTIAGQASVYIDVVGERKELVAHQQAPHGNPGSNPGTVQASGDLTYDAPKHWKDLGASGMRAAAFEMSAGEEKTTITVTPLGLTSGSVLGNINRWRKQIGLEDMDEDQLLKTQEHFHILGQEAVFVDLAHTEPKKDSMRTIAAIFRTQKNTWFFKMTGNHVITGKEKGAFKQFLNSVRFQKQTNQTPQEKANGSPDTQASGGLKYGAPQHWKDLGASGMRAAAFEVAEGEEKTTITAIPLGLTSGSVLSNINRWRKQIGLDEIDENQLKKLQEPFQILGQEAVFVDLAHTEPKKDSMRTIAAIFRTQKNTWFFKMNGNHVITGKEKDSFKKFLHSVRF